MSFSSRVSFGPIWSLVFGGTFACSIESTALNATVRGSCFPLTDFKPPRNNSCVDLAGKDSNQYKQRVFKDAESGGKIAKVILNL